MALANPVAKVSCLPSLSPAGVRAGPSATYPTSVLSRTSLFHSTCLRNTERNSSRKARSSRLRLKTGLGEGQSHSQRQTLRPQALENSGRESTSETTSSSEEERSPQSVGAPDTDASTSGRPSGPGESGALYWFMGGLASIGILETAYLTYEKLTGGPVACAVGGGGAGGCSDVLDSEYGTLFGLPLSLYGFAAYSSVLILSQLVRTSQVSSSSNPSLSKWLLLAATSAMAAASGYFMYILNFKLTGATCTYCVGSAILSGSLLLTTLSTFKGPDLRKAAAPQLGLSLAVVLALSLAFADVRSAFAGSFDDINLDPIEPEVTTMSSSAGTALAKHLKSIGAKMYGAFWCGHCFEQKQAFGQEAMQYVDYVECYPEGYRRGVNLAKPCLDANIEGFPTWIIKGKPISGEQDLKQLAIVSEFDPATIPQ